MGTMLTSISQGGGQTVPLQRPTDAVAAVLRRAYRVPPLPDDMAALLARIDLRLSC